MHRELVLPVLLSAVMPARGKGLTLKELLSLYILKLVAEGKNPTILNSSLPCFRTQTATILL